MGLYSMYSVNKNFSYSFRHCLIGIYEEFELVNLQVLVETGPRGQ